MTLAFAADQPTEMSYSVKMLERARRNGIKGVYSHSGHIVGQDCAHLLSTECVLAGLGRRREEINKYVLVRRDTPRLPVSERVRTCVAAA